MSKIIFTLALTACALMAQSPAPPVFIRLEPVALDAAGQPVTDLTSSDFKITDDAKPETILFFRRPATEKTAAPGTLEFANRPSGVTPHATVLLFDLMNENMSDRLDNWHAFDKSLPQIENGDSLYFYLLNLEGELVPIHPIGPRSASDRTWPHDVVPAFDQAMKAASHGRPVHLGQEDLVKKTFHNLEVLAGQLAAFPGRRDILWVTDGVQNVYNTKLPCNGDWVDCALYVPHLAVTLAKAGVAVDPVSYSRDLSTAVNKDMANRNVTWTPGNSGVAFASANASNALGDVSPQNAQSAQGMDPALDLTQMALLSGGRTFFRIDIRDVVAQVGTDAKDTYEILYDPSTANWDNKFHKIHITCERKGVRLQVRERYYALADARPAADRQKGDLIAAYQNPGDVSDVGLQVKLAPVATGMHLAVRINPSDILFKEQGGKYAGAITFLVSDRGASGPIGDPSVASFNLDLTKEQYDKVMKEGIPFEQDHAIPDAVKQVRLMVMDQNTNAVGSLTFPVR